MDRMSTDEEEDCLMTLYEGRQRKSSEKTTWQRNVQLLRIVEKMARYLLSWRMCTTVPC